MDYNAVMQAISTVGFPIVCCGVLFYQNDKLRQTIDSLKDTISENTIYLKTLTRKESEN
jgi:hypothetical protein